MVQEIRDTNYGFSPQITHMNFELPKTREVEALVDCAICLNPISTRTAASTSPCGHIWDLECIAKWLEISKGRTCPLCKSTVEKILISDGQAGVVALVVPSPLPAGEADEQNDLVEERRSHSHRMRRLIADDKYIRLRYALVLARRRYVYRNGLKACHVGSNRYTQYRNVTPTLCRGKLHSKAKAFIRRELSVFPFLDTFSAESSGYCESRHSNITSRDIEFLTGYLSALIQLVDTQTIKGAKLASNTISDYLGHANTTIFLHELRAFLKSPFETLVEYDNVVQYRNIAEAGSQDDYGRPLCQVSQEQIDKNLSTYRTDPLLRLPRAYRLRRK